MQTIEEAKQALEATQEVEITDQKTGETQTKVVMDIGKASKAIKFMASQAFNPVIRG